MSFRYPRSPFNIVLLSAFIFFNFCQGKFCFFLLSLIFEKVQLQFLKLLKSSAKFLVKKKVGEGPTAADREEKEQNELLAGRDACASAVQYIAEKAESLTGKVDFSTDGEAARYLVTEASIFVVYVKNKAILC